MKHLLLIISITLLGYATFAQEVPQIIPPSPTAASLSKYAEVPVSYYNGLTNISIPLYEIIEGDISVPIALTYHASGIKVNQEATWVGLRWDIQAGGVISRMVMNKDDFDPAFNYFNSSVPFFSKPTTAPKEFLQLGCKPQVVNSATGEMKEVDLSKYINSTVNDPYEFEPDQYSFNFQDYTGKFVLDRKYQAILANQTKMNLQPDSKGDTWTVKTEDGFVYQFDKYESYTDYQISRPIHTAWYLTKITSTKGDSVTFHYDQDGTFSRPTGGIYEERFETRTFNGTGTPGTPEEGRICQRDPVKKLTEQKAYRNLVLSYIDFTNGRVKFDYNSDRKDLKGAKRLNAVQIFKKDKNGNVVTTPYQQHVFAYDYFIGTADDDIRYEPGDYTTKRLKLLSVQETSSGVSKPPHVFSYNEGTTTTTLPSKNSFARDHWDYFNGVFGNTTLIPAYNGKIYLDSQTGQDVKLEGANRNPDPRYTQAFTLKRIQYPTQGYTVFTYEAHDFDPDKSAKSPVPTDRDIVIKRDEPHYLSHDKPSNGQASTVSKTLDVSKAVTQNGTVRVKLKAAFRLSNTYNPQNPPGVIFSSTNAYFELYQPNGARISTVYITDGTCQGNVCEYENTYILQPGKYTWKSYIAASPQGFEGTYVNYIFDEIVEPSLSEGSLLKAGGLRINTITSRDGLSNSEDITRKFVYTYEEDRDKDGTNAVYSYGRRMSYPVYERYEQNRGFYSTGDAYECLWFVRTASSSVSLNGTAGGSVVGYDQVTVLRGPNGTLGKTVYQYENTSDVVYFYDQRRPPGLTNLSSNKNGLLKQQTDYAYQDKAFRKTKEVVNNYVLKENSVIYGVHDEDIGYFTDLGQCGFRLFFYPAIQSDWIQLSYTIERIFDQNSEAALVETKTTYQYESIPKHYQTKARILTDSEGRTQTTSYKYALDFATDTYGSGLLNIYHMHRQVLEQTTQVQTGTQSPLTTEKTTTTYSVLNKRVVPTLVSYYPTGNSSDVKNIRYDYDGRGNIKEVTDMDGIPTAYLWGYNYTLPVAQVVGATYSEAVAKISLIGLQSMTDNALRTELGKLRTLSKGHVTIYTYDPLVGITSQTDPDGRLSTYQYDGLNRLQWIKSQEGHVVQKFDYQYAQP